jgi:hypothetical protein
VFRPREPLEGDAVPVLVSPAVAKAAATDGYVPLHVEQQTVQGKIVGIVRHVPSVDGDVVVADRAWWFAAANTQEPGSAVPGEIWLDALRPGATKQLAAAPFAALDATSQRAVYAGLRTDPLAQGTLDILLITAVVGLVLAAIGVILGSSATYATRAASCSTSRRRAPHRRTSAVICASARSPSPVSGFSAD